MDKDFYNDLDKLSLRALRWIRTFLEDKISPSTELEILHVNKSELLFIIKSKLISTKSIGRVRRYFTRFYLKDNIVEWMFIDLAATIWMLYILVGDNQKYINSKIELNNYLENLINIYSFELKSGNILHIPFPNYIFDKSIEQLGKNQPALDFMSLLHLVEHQLQDKLETIKIHQQKFEMISNFIHKNMKWLDIENIQQIDWCYEYMIGRERAFNKDLNSSISSLLQSINIRVDNSLEKSQLNSRIKRYQKNKVPGEELVAIARKKQIKDIPNYLIEFVRFYDPKETSEKYYTILASFCIIYYKITNNQYGYPALNKDYLINFITIMNNSWRREKGRLKKANKNIPINITKQNATKIGKCIKKANKKNVQSIYNVANFIIKNLDDESIISAIQTMSQIDKEKTESKILKPYSMTIMAGHVTKAEEEK